MLVCVEEAGECRSQTLGEPRSHAGDRSSLQPCSVRVGLMEGNSGTGRGNSILPESVCSSLFPAKMLVYFHVNTAYHSTNVDELPLFTPVSVAGKSLLCDRDAGCGPTEPSFLTVSSGRASPRPTALDHRSR